MRKISKLILLILFFGVLSIFFVFSVNKVARHLLADIFLAATSTPKIDNLSKEQKVIKALYDRIKILEQQKAKLQSDLEVESLDKIFIRPLQIKSEGKDVEKLQELLRDLPDIYPNGEVTGYFGQLTEEALKRFQKENDLEQVGIFGPKTRKNLLEVVAENLSQIDLPSDPLVYLHLPKELQESNKTEILTPSETATTTEEGSETFTASSTEILPEETPQAEETPPEATPLPSAPTSTATATTTTADITPTVRSNGSPTGTLAYNATSTAVSLTTNEKATCKYATATGTSYLNMSSFSSTGNLYHSFVFPGLTSGKTYNFYVKCSDTAGNINPDDYAITFSTASPPDTTPPTISQISATNIGTTTAKILWTTDEPADSKVEYGKTTSYINTTPLDSTLITSHSVSLSGLSPNTQYNYRVYSKDAAGNQSISQNNNFSTGK